MPDVDEAVVSRAVRHQAPGALAWVIVLSESDDRAHALELLQPLRRCRLSVLEVVVDHRFPRQLGVAAVVGLAAELEAEGLPVLFGGVRQASTLAALAAAQAQAPGLLTVDGSLLAIAWRSPLRQRPTLLLRSGDRCAAARLHLGAAALGGQARVGNGLLGTPAADRSLRSWRGAAVEGGWSTPATSSRRLVPAAAAVALGAGAAVLAATPVGATQRAGDGVAHHAPTVGGRTRLAGTKVHHTQRQGDIRPFATGSQALVDAAGFKWFVNTDITFSTSSSASGAMSEGNYTHPVPASTLNGGTVASALNDAYDGYNAIFVSVNGT